MKCSHEYEHALITCNNVSSYLICIRRYVYDYVVRTCIIHTVVMSNKSTYCFRKKLAFRLFVSTEILPCPPSLRGARHCIQQKVPHPSSLHTRPSPLRWVPTFDHLISCAQQHAVRCFVRIYISRMILLLYIYVLIYMTCIMGPGGPNYELRGPTNQPWARSCWL